MNPQPHKDPPDRDVPDHDGTEAGGITDVPRTIRKSGDGDSDLGEIELAGPGGKGRYRELAEIARGGMGAILDLEDSDLGRRVAKKILLDLDDPDLTARFVEEAQITGQLQHPNIVPVHEIGRDEYGRLYFTMKRVEGNSLEEILHCGVLESEFPLPRCLEVFLKVCDAVSFAHSKRVLHRDLKPENVMVGRFGEVHVMDWGLAKVRGRPSQRGESEIKSVRSSQAIGKTAAGGVVGTPSYMAPEQAVGETASLDERTDIWALGAVLYAILCRRSPYEGDKVEEVMRRAAHGMFAPPGKIARGRGVPPELEAVCLKAMAFEKKDRYASVEDLKLEIQAYLDRRPVQAYRYSLFERGTRWVQRHPATSMAGSVAAFLILFGGALTAFQVQRARIAELQATRFRREASSERYRADSAETERDTATRTLEKSRKVANVLRSADLELGDALRRLRQVMWSTADQRIRQEAVIAVWRDVARFEAGVEKDSASQATWLACKGLLKRMAGARQEAKDLFDRSREADEDVAHGWLFEAMGLLEEVLAGIRLPATQLSHDRIVFGPMPPRSQRAEALQRDLHDMVDKVGRCPVWGESAKEEFHRFLDGLAALQEGDLDTAEKGLTAALALPETRWLRPPLHLARAKVRYLKKDFDGAIDDCRACLKGEPGHVSATFFLGQFLSARGLRETNHSREARDDFQEAIDCFGLYIRHDSAGAAGYASRGLARMNLADFESRWGGEPRKHLEKAIADFDRAIEADPANVALFSNRGTVRMKLAGLPGVAAAQRRALYGEALADFDACLESDPGFPAARLNRATVYQAMAELAPKLGSDPTAHYRSALQDLTAIVEASPKDPIYLSARALLCHCWWSFKLGKGIEDDALRDMALADLDKATACGERFVPAYIHRALWYESLGSRRRDRGQDPSEMYEVARKALHEALRIDEQHPSALNNLSALLVKMAAQAGKNGQDPRPLLEEAVSAAQRASAQRPAMVMAKYNLGMAWLKIAGIDADPWGAFEKARTAFEACRSLAPTYSPAVKKLGLLELKAGDAMLRTGKDPTEAWENAIGHFTEAIRLEPDSPAAHNNRGNARLTLAKYHAAKGVDPVPDYRGALSDYDEALRLKPGLSQALVNRGTVYMLLAEVLSPFGENTDALYEKAAADYGVGVKRFPRNWQILANLTNLFEILGRHEKALDLNEMAAAQAPAGTNVIERRRQRLKSILAMSPWQRMQVVGMNRYRDGNFRMSERWFSKALEAAIAAGAFDDPAQGKALFDLVQDRAELLCLLAKGRFGRDAEPALTTAEQAESFLSAAVDGLKTASALAAFDMKRLRENSHLAALHEREDFKALAGNGGK